MGGVTAVAVTTNGFDFTAIRTTLQLADRYLSEQNYEQAIIEFEKVLEIEPMNVDAYLGLAEAYMALGQTDKAVRILEEGIEKTDNDRLKDKLEEIRESLKPVTTEAEVTVTVTVTAPVPVETTADVTTVGATTAAVTTVAETTAAVTTVEETATEEITTKPEITTTIFEDNEIEQVQTYYTVQKDDTIKLIVNTNEKIEWTSLNPYVAQVDQKGTVNVLHKGRASVRAKYGNETKFFVVDSLSENVRKSISNAVMNGTFGTLTDIIVYPSYYNSAAGSGEIIECDDYDDSAYSFEVGATTGGRKALVYNYFYLENNVGENNRIMTNWSTYNGLTFYDCKTSFYYAPQDICSKTFRTKGKITLNVELFYQEETDPNGNGDQFYFRIQSKDNALPYFGIDYPHDTIFVSLRTSETLKNELLKKIDKNNSLGVCKITIENYRSYFYYTRGAGNEADLVKVEFSGNTYTDNPESVVIGGKEYKTNLLKLDLSNMELYNISNIRFMKNLESLNLNGNNLYELYDLANLQKLKELYIKNNNAISEADIETLKKLLPNCKIYY